MSAHRQSPVTRSARPEPAGPPPVDALAFRPVQMLLRIARQSRLGDPEGCAAILTLLATGRVVRAHLQHVLGQLGLNEIKFSTLITLYALDPDPSTPAELALQSRVSRAAMSDTLEALRGGGWVDRERSTSDRRTLHIRLTARGRDLIETAVRPFLAAVGRCAEALTAAERRSLTRTCGHLTALFQAPPVPA
ncbi:MAG: MarR family transcriptional regulator [Verrucomicrobia bacterium]|nr:MarR family transcriptional regulator [Verrucomicrobiota bacterium]